MSAESLLPHQEQDAAGQITARSEEVALQGLASAVSRSESKVQNEVEPYGIFTNPYERMEYIHLTDDLITTLDGSDELGDGQPYDAVVYLDSSARPVDWMVRGLWSFAARKDEQGNPVPRPEILFANMDARRMGPSASADDTESLAQTYPSLAAMSGASDKKVLIVDEIAVSGDTISQAVDRFRKAFPDLAVNGYAWMDERNKKDFDNVRWYERGSDRYRAVLDPTEIDDGTRAKLEDKGINPYSKSKWLAVPNPEQGDVKKLRGEIQRMVQEVQNGKMPYWPSTKRSDEDYDRQVAAQNDGLSPREFGVFRTWFKQHYAPNSILGQIRKDADGPLSEREVRRNLSTRELQEPRPVLNERTKRFADKFGLLTNR